MLVYIIRRLGQGALVVSVMASVVFLAMYAVGNPVDVLAPPDASDAEKLLIARELGLDKPLWDQFFVFIGNALHGDLGKSFVYNEPTLQLILQRLPATLELAVTALTLAIAIGIPLGLYAGLKSESWFSRIVMSGSILGFSLPNFWIGMMLILLFSVQLKWLPAGGRGETVNILGVPLSFLTWDGLRHLLLPALTMSIYKAALIVRLVRAATRETVMQEYVRFARAKGLSRQRIVLVHILKNIMLPVVTVIGLEFGAILAFAVVTESVFAYPGMGKLLIDSINHLDRPVVVAYLMFTAFLFVIINFVVDLIYAVIDPRVSLVEAKG
ncbi:ABC transporter permease [Pararhizobium sp. YC-54]|uniref:ABC transporter permease n=1 Tax=Pararhizobium sp. YC-54 TaxID=2986920 RepID=UPI0021F7A736|nr:ABC transporter permease [Pararhizobium sp. YC-54]MCW0002169.1 ABC transporter permease [Pararhizobium sp. YC-54]